MGCTNFTGRLRNVSLLKSLVYEKTGCRESACDASNRLARGPIAVGTFGTGRERGVEMSWSLQRPVRQNLLFLQAL
jgi:hypothetical protein